VFRTTGKAEKLQKCERSDNPRYPHVFVGKQAIYSDDNVQMIVAVVEDHCDDNCDCFTLTPQRILKNTKAKYTVGQPIKVSQQVGEKCWKLTALL
jgi:hypothetical protein